MDIELEASTYDDISDYSKINNSQNVVYYGRFFDTETQQNCKITRKNIQNIVHFGRFFSHQNTAEFQGTRKNSQNIGLYGRLFHTNLELQRARKT